MTIITQNYGEEDGWPVRATVDSAGFIEWGAGRGVLTAPQRADRPALGSGGNGGVFGKTCNGKVVRRSTRGGSLKPMERAIRSTFGACHVSLASVDALPVGAVLRGAQGWAVGPLLQAAQGQALASMARGFADKLRASMRRDKGESGPSIATAEDGTGAGVEAGAVWLATEGPRAQGETLASVVWRAVVNSMSADSLGESIELSSVSGEWLAASALPLPGWYESREDTAIRLQVERGRLSRFRRLSARVDWLTAKGGRNRAEVIGKVHRAAIQLLRGVSLDQAASGAGFKGSGKASAADRFAQAAKRLGFGVQLHVRMSTKPQAARVTHEVLPACQDTADGGGLPAIKHPLPGGIWSQTPSAVLPLQNGRGAKLLGGLGVERINRAHAKRARQSAQAVRLSDRGRGAKLRNARATAKRDARARVLARAFKAAGMLAGGRGAMGITASMARKFKGGGATVRHSRQLARAAGRIA